MVTTTFIPVLQLNVFHEYFESGRAEGISVTPSVETTTFMKQLGLVFKTNPSEIQLYIDSEFLSTFLNAISAPNAIEFLEFTLKVQDPNFYLYTALPLIENISYLYTSENEVNEWMENSIQLKPIQETQQNAFGRVRIYLKDLADFQDKSLHFSIYFDARATRWDYYIINRSGLHLLDAKLETHNNFTFEGPTKVQLQNGEEAFWFSSGARFLKLAEIPMYKFELQNDSETIITVLPYPNPSSVQQYEEHGIKAISSPMYIYV
ncbi:MAG: hypothetical protein R2776_08175 [Flavobacteriaceae bacterium]|nr:hypothetical protein [Flavobacteriaceae bacterium]